MLIIVLDDSMDYLFLVEEVKKIYISEAAFGAVQPTNSYERCKLIVFKEDETRSCRCWNPTQADLVADDWELLEKEFGGVKDDE